MTRLLLLVATGLLAFSVPAGAHSDQALVAMEATAGPDGTSIAVRARVTFANDGHAAVGAVITADAMDPVGQVTGPVALAEVDEGEFQGSLSVTTPGQWTVRVASADPVGSAEALVVVAPLPSPSSTTTTTTTSDGGSAAEASGPVDDGDGGGPGVVWIVVGAGALVGVGVGIAVVLRRRAS